MNQFDDHIACFERVFSLEPINRGLVATAFMNAAGANLLADVIGELGYVFDNIADYIDIYVGNVDRELNENAYILPLWHFPVCC